MTIIDLECAAGRKLTSDQPQWREPCPEIPAVHLVIDDQSGGYLILNLCRHHDAIAGEVLGP